MTLTVEPILPRFGAEISGVDISAPLDATVQAELQKIARIRSRISRPAVRRAGKERVDENSRTIVAPVS
jgi:hypothetical protein